MEYSFLKITKQNKSDEWLTPASPDDRGKHCGIP